MSRLTSTRSDCHKIIFRLSTRVTVMITAMVTRDLALPAPPVAAQSPLLDSSYLSYYLRRAAPERCQARPRFQRHPNDDQLTGLVMGVDDQLPAPGRGNSG